MASKIKDVIDKCLIKDNTISELEMNGTNSIFIRRNGKREEIADVFSDLKEYTDNTLELAKIINPDDSLEFLTEGKLDLGESGTARVHIVWPPVSDVPLVTIAKKSTSLTTLDEIFKSGSMSFKMLNFLKACVEARFNIVFSGSTGSGKTTFLEAMTKEVPKSTRIGVVEDSPELNLIQDNVCYLRSTPWKPGMDSNKEVTLDWCVRQINRMRTDLLIIGETRGKEFKEFITASNSGMEGSMTTLHANSPRLALQKMTQFVMEAQPQPVQIINKSIANTIDLIVQLDKNELGEYKTTSIESISNTLGTDEAATIATTPLTKYNPAIKSWDDRFLISDKMRATFNSLGYDTNTFMKSGSRQSSENNLKNYFKR